MGTGGSVSLKKRGTIISELELTTPHKVIVPCVCTACIVPIGRYYVYAPTPSFYESCRVDLPATHIPELCSVCVTHIIKDSKRRQDKRSYVVDLPANSHGDTRRTPYSRTLFSMTYPLRDHSTKDSASHPRYNDLFPVPRARVHNAIRRDILMLYPFSRKRRTEDCQNPEEGSHRSSRLLRIFRTLLRA